MNKNTVTKALIIVMIFVMGYLFAEIISMKSSIDYYDGYCPTCGSDEVLHLHDSPEGEQFYKCPDCHQEFQIYSAK